MSEQIVITAVENGFILSWHGKDYVFYQMNDVISFLKFIEAEINSPDYEPYEPEDGHTIEMYE